MSAQGLLFVFSGPSGAGKNTIMQELMAIEPRLRQLPTATTRPRRDYEQEGREHEFISEAAFRQRIVDKELIEWQIIHDKGVYGVPRATVQKLIRSGDLAVADVDVLGAMALKEEFGDFVVLIYVIPPDKSTIERRLREREDVKTEAELRTRMRRFEFELSFQDRYDHIVTNHDGLLEDSVQQAHDIVLAELEKPRDTDLAVLGWEPSRLRCFAAAVVADEEQLLLENGQLPRTPVQAQHMPFESLQAYLSQQIDVPFLPTRPHADKRVVDIGFEAPQLITATVVPDGTDTIARDHYYILQCAEPLHDLPAHWQWTPISACNLDGTLLQLLIERQADLQN